MSPRSLDTGPAHSDSAHSASTESQAPAGPTSARRQDPRAALDRDLERLERRSSEESFWHSLALLGTVGWSVAIPSALGAWSGHLLDQRWDTGIHFTLGLLSLGVALGTYTAWRALSDGTKSRHSAREPEDQTGERRVGSRRDS